MKQENNKPPLQMGRLFCYPYVLMENDSQSSVQPGSQTQAPETGLVPGRRFGPSARALKQRRVLVRGLKVMAVVSLLVLALAFQPPMLWLNLLKWALLAGLVWGLAHARGELLLQPLLDREVLLHAHALEVRRGVFKRFVVFESLRHIQIEQLPNERIIRLRLDTDDDSLALRDLEGLEQVFAAVVKAKPDKTMIEVQQRGFDWGEPLPWAVVVLVAGLLITLLASSGWGHEAFLQADGRLLLLNGAVLGAWRPFARGQHWRVVGSELGCHLLLAMSGALVLFG